MIGRRDGAVTCAVPVVMVHGETRRRQRTLPTASTRSQSAMTSCPHSGGLLWLSLPFHSSRGLAIAPNAPNASLPPFSGKTRPHACGLCPRSGMKLITAAARIHIRWSRIHIRCGGSTQPAHGWVGCGQLLIANWRRFGRRRSQGLAVCGRVASGFGAGCAVWMGGDLVQGSGSGIWFRDLVQGSGSGRTAVQWPHGGLWMQAPP